MTALRCVLLPLLSQAFAGNAAVIVACMSKALDAVAELNNHPGACEKCVPILLCRPALT